MSGNIDLVDNAKSTYFWWFEDLEFYPWACNTDDDGDLPKPKIITETINIVDKVEDVQRPKWRGPKL